MKNEPKTLLEIVRHFSDEKTCVEFIAQLKWVDGKPYCPKCGSDNCIGLSTRPIYKCREKGCKKQFSVKVGTIFENSPIPLTKWIPALWMIMNSKNGVSSCEIARSLGITQKSAWHLLHRCRKVLSTGTFQKLSGEVECDETYMGGKEKFKHRRHIPSSFWVNKGVKGKTPVMGMLEIGGEVRAQVIKSAGEKSLEPVVLQNIEEGSTLLTDGHPAYRTIAGRNTYQHGFVDHTTNEYVRGNVHTNGIENFWSCFKRTVKGTYIQIAPFHIDRYLDEQAFRYNTRKVTDKVRFEQGMSGIINRKLTYAELTGAIAA